MQPTNTPVQNPTLLTVMQYVVHDQLSGMRTAFPAQIETYDYKTAQASVKPLIHAVYPDGSTMEQPVIHGVPVVFPRTSQGSITFPLVRGDTCLVICAERSIDDWLHLGGDSIPADQREYDLNDAIAIPGLFPFNTQTKVTSSDKFEIHFGDQSVSIDTSGNIEIGSASTQYVVTKTYKDSLDTMLAALKEFMTAMADLNAVPTAPLLGGAIGVPAEAFNTAAGVYSPAPPNSLTSKTKAE